MRVRLALAALLAVPLLGGTASADDGLEEWCFENLGFRVGALVCTRLP